MSQHHASSDRLHRTDLARGADRPRDAQDDRLPGRGSARHSAAGLDPEADLRQNLGEVLRAANVLRVQLQQLRGAVDPSGPRDMRDARSRSNRAERSFELLTGAMRAAQQWAVMVPERADEVSAAASQVEVLRAEIVDLRSAMPNDYRDIRALEEVAWRNPSGHDEVFAEEEGRAHSEWNAALDARADRVDTQPAMDGRQDTHDATGPGRAEPSQGVNTPNAADRRDSDADDGEHQQLPAGLRGNLEAAAGTSLSDVRVHAGPGSEDSARAMGAAAYTVGQDIYFAPRRYDPDSRSGQALIAHEVAHTMQQRSAGTAPQRKDVSQLEINQESEPAEHEANAFATAFSSGRKAAAPQQTFASVRVSRFLEREHKELGDAGSGGLAYEIAGLQLSHGDIVMLSGDHFTAEQITELWQKKSDKPGHRPGTQDELLCALHQYISTDPRFLEGGVWHGIEFSDAVEKAVEQRYYALASNNASHFADPGGPGFGRAGFSAGSAGATYRDHHERAIAKAYQAGVSGESEGAALILEAAGQHHLTDAFAAGHVSTKRVAIMDHWNSRYPDFGLRFIDKMVRDMAVKLNDSAEGLSGAITISMFEDAVRDEINKKLDGKPLPTVGDIVSLMVHHFDNENGLGMTNDLGWQWTAYGDGHLDMVPDAGEASVRSNKDIATMAVQFGCEDVRLAYDLGKSQAANPMDVAEVHDQIRQRVQAPCTPSDKFGPEQFMPRIDTSFDQGESGWQAKDLETLWDARVRSTEETTFGTYIVEDMAADGTMGHELEDIKNGLPVKENPFSLWHHIFMPVALGHGHVFPRRAFTEAVLKQVRSKPLCKAFLLDVVS